MDFVHLHVHSSYSFLDGASSLERLLQKTVELGMGALALTDHNRLTGAIRFYDLARKLGLKPILGAEIDLEGGWHLTLLCKNRSGYASLCRLLTELHLSHKDGKPVATRTMLEKFHAGLVALSGCSRGEIPSLLAKGDTQGAKQALNFYRSLFDDDFFIEVIRYPCSEGMSLSYRLADFARQYRIPMVATNNVHYAEMEEYRVKELLNAIGCLVPVSQLGGFRSVEQYLKSPQEMQALFRDFPSALKMTLEIASRCELELELGRPRFPTFGLPPGESSYSYLSKLAYVGARTRYKRLTLRIRERLEMELGTIRGLGFCSYFLVVWDIVHWSGERGIRLQARGSAVDSLVVYLLGISNVDPLRYNLLFERFMHPLRPEPPDIDLDIDRCRRDEVRDYVYEKYGAENVACVGTVNTYMARGAIRDAGKALQLPPAIIEEACKGIHYLSASGLMRHAAHLPELRDSTVYSRPELQDFFRLCLAIDGFPRHMSVHLGGLLIGEGRLAELVPLQYAGGGDVISQYDKDDIERLGIVKMDLLSLPTLTVIGDTLSNIRESKCEEIDLQNIPPDDPSAFAMLRDGKSIGTFQLESPAQREMAGRLLPECFGDIIVSISLVRPGPLKSNMDKAYLPRRHGREPVKYLHPKLRDALGETLGVILYQEQVLKVAHDLAGMSYAEADGFRRAMTHDRTAEEMEKMRESFIGSAAGNGVSSDIAEEVFEQLSAFAAYGFCKAHAVAYAELAYQTLWLKCHYTAEFFAALLSNQLMGYYPPRVLLADAGRLGVKILPLDINRSHGRYTVEQGALRVSLRQLRGMSEEALASILEQRAGGEFLSLRDFVLRATVSEDILQNLVRAGAFDAFGTRCELLLQLPALLHLKKQMYSAARLFPDDNVVCQRPVDWMRDEQQERMVSERELLGLDLSAHPFDLRPPGEGFTRMKDLPALPTGALIRIAGSVIRFQTPPTRNGRRVLYIIMEDGTGIADVTVFSDVQEKCGRVLFREGWLQVRGKIQRRGPQSLSIIAEEVKAYQDGSEFDTASAE
jgi:error-prone DNA polymerase